jgi:hypothetical protein
MLTPNFANFINTTRARNKIYRTEWTVSSILQLVLCLTLSLTIHFSAIYWLSVVSLGGSYALPWKYAYNLKHLFSEINTSVYTARLSETKTRLEEAYTSLQNKKTKTGAFSPPTNYTDWATAACRRSLQYTEISMALFGVCFKME